MLATSAAATAFAQGEQLPAPAARDAVGGWQDIVVTAQRRDERAQDVPITITAFSNERMQQQGITQAQDLQGTVPSLVVGLGNQGAREAQSFTIRGQGATLQASPGVVIYMNEVPLPAAISVNQQGGPGNFVDLENMQVLNGPQGTLFGRNTTGGAVLLVPRKPTNEFEGYVQAKIGSYDNREFEGAINLPLVDDKVLLRVSGAYQDRDGFTRDIVWNKDRDDLHWYSGRVGLTLRPSETFENYTMVYGAYSRNNGTGQIHRGFNIAGLAASGACVEGPTVPGVVASCDVYRAADAEAEALGPRRTAYSTDAFQKTKTWGASNTSALELNDELTLRNIVSYQHFRTSFAVDNDATVLQLDEYDTPRFPAAGQVTLPGDGTPINYLPPSATTPRDNFRTITEELQLQGSLLDKRLIFTVGGFYFDQRPTGQQGAAVYGYCPAAFTGLCDVYRLNYAVTTKSKALYAQSTIDLGLLTPALQNLKITGGFRYTWDNISGSANYYLPLNSTPETFFCIGDNSVATNLNQCQFDANLKTRAPTWTIGADYRFSPDLMVYVKASRGYKAGGINTNAVFENTRTFQPENVTSYEGGVKTNFTIAGMPTRLNATYYYLDYKNIQRAAADYNPTTVALGARVLGATARIQGVELEASVRPFPGLEVGGNFSYTDAKYKKYEFTANLPMVDCSGGLIGMGQTAVLTCIPFSGVAPYIYNFHVAAEKPLGDNLGTISIFANYSHTSSQNTSANDLPGSEPGEKLEPYGTLSLSVDWRKIAGSDLDLGFYATNLTNKLYRIGNPNLYNSLNYWSTIYGQPRMYGVRARYSF
ncbi:TonB-dependent receptor [Sphingobium vermicomposti]|uniref:Iron complex outermembrane receptor protein n=1 Tax=Sphingobium vermicomposti TaxID=529005 RepID=A0A846MH20_9SPHN|nr:TonB-dependent receptor [Sphingobium vermicomposti]NIJ17915.1 iron complex outermembrane receptor protein [Sphingobium vermicomposti]